MPDEDIIGFEDVEDIPYGIQVPVVDKTEENRHVWSSLLKSPHTSAESRARIKDGTFWKRRTSEQQPRLQLNIKCKQPPLQLNIRTLPWKHISPYKQLNCILFNVPKLQEFEAVSNYEGMYIRCSNLPAAHSQMIWHLTPRNGCCHFCFHNNQQEQDIFQRLGSITESETIFIRALLHTVRTGRIISLCPLDQGLYVTLII